MRNPRTAKQWGTLLCHWVSTLHWKHSVYWLAPLPTPLCLLCSYACVYVSASASLSTLLTTVGRHIQTQTKSINWDRRKNERKDRYRGRQKWRCGNSDTDNGADTYTRIQMQKQKQKQGLHQDRCTSSARQTGDVSVLKLIGCTTSSYPKWE